ncbi:MAG: hypothetical protein ABSA93_16690 [Streptosporangiaceae bacterium]|jgi:hypothetical protein
MIVFLLLLGGLLYGTAAFAGGTVYALAGIAFAMWIAIACLRLVRRPGRRDA